MRGMQVTNTDKAITELQVDNKWMKKTHFEFAKKVDDKLEKILTTLNTGAGKIASLKQSINGNGDKGLKIRVEDLENGQTAINLAIAKTGAVVSSIFIFLIYIVPWIKEWIK